jgi:D-proline reductase (dithiol) PrdB
MDSPDPARRIFVSYVDKSREYYLAQNFNNPYRWAHNATAPWTPLSKPLSRSRVGLVTTASLVTWTTPEPAPGEVPNAVFGAPVAPPPDRLYTMHRFWDKDATHTNDVESFCPVRRLSEAQQAGRIGSLSPRFYGVPTEYSQRKTNEVDAPEVLRLCREDQVDVAVLVPLCPVCHQSTSLTARYLEANGIPTVLVGSARDIVEQVAVPRFVFTDFPLGNPCGAPYDTAMQTAIVGMALDLLEKAWQPQTTVQTPFHWPTEDWRANFMRIGEDNLEDLRRQGEERRLRQSARKAGSAAG